MKVLEPPTVSKMWKINVMNDGYVIRDGALSVPVFYVEVTESVVSGLVGSERLTILFYRADDPNYPVRRSVPALYGEPMGGVPSDLLTALRAVCVGSIFTRREHNPWDVLGMSEGVGNE